MMRIIFSLMDADGDGTVSLQEFQAAHERIFKAMDTDHDGTVSTDIDQAARDVRFVPEADISRPLDYLIGAGE
jgi:hypothetical protein